MKMVNSTEFEEFIRPWNFPNKLGIPEIAYDELQFLDQDLGEGKKSTTRLALWKGRRVAVKTWRTGRYASDYKSHKHAYSYWELSRYCDLASVQGQIIPKLLFCLRVDSSTMIGMELGTPVTADDGEYPKAVTKVMDTLKGLGWKQREESCRRDNFVWMMNGDKSRRLVAIDLESFIPCYGAEVPVSNPLIRKNRRPTPFGVPEITPAEVELPGYTESRNFWSAKPHRVRNEPAKWEGRDIRIVVYDCSSGGVEEELRKTLETLLKFKEQQGSLIPELKFVVRDHKGRILLGFSWYNIVRCERDEPRVEKLANALAEVGIKWKLPEVGTVEAGEKGGDTIVDCLTDLQWYHGGENDLSGTGSDSESMPDPSHLSIDECTHSSPNSIAEGSASE